jgi:hypothetical protein
MMELALNLVWAIIVAASYILLFRRFAIGVAGNASGASRAQCTIALTCFLAILFPVISLTDDLHEMQATAEEASTSGPVMKRCVAGHSSTRAQTLHSVLFIFEPFTANGRWSVLGVVAAEQIQGSSSGLHLSARGRAPPSFGIRQIS